ncbi:MAG TPA: carboxypeptidase-like regulatory domain-containing protein, partial [Flavisolibacter sp.]|nr:carboxypeptidase-like regulatory domain-containing protein [Flavisolibacter sp.]
PAIREMHQELMRRNISRLKGDRKADTNINQSYPLFHFGMADWSVSSAQTTGGINNTRASLGLGAVVAGGETNLSLNYNSDEKLNLRQQFYQWKVVNNNHSALRQITAGKIFAQSTSSIFAPVIGIQVTNTPTTYRRSFGTYTLSNTTEPGWTVELYINNILVNYVKADASGFYTFEVPMVYGNSIVKLRFYGPWGEERTSEKYVSVPFNFIPLHQFEYNVTAGIVEDKQKSRYSRAAFNYGLSRRMTVGGGMEYLSSVTSGTSLPFINASLRVGSSMLVSGEHTHSVKSKIMLNYRLPSNLQFDLAYTGYDKDQTAILFNYSSEKRMMLSMPLRARKFTAFSRLTVNQFTLPPKPGVKTKEKFTSSEFLVSAVVSGVSSNLTTFAVFDRPGNPLVYSNLSLNFRLPRGIRFRPQAQYEYGHGNFSFIKGEVEKSIFKRGFMNIAYEKALVPDNMSSVTVGFRYNFSFAQTFFSAGKIDHAVATTQSARGSLMYDAKASYLGFKNQSSVGTGGLIILAYLDLNCNGRRDRGEPKAHGLKLHINGGRTELSTGDTTIRITALETSTSYYVEIDKNSFNNIAWQIRNATLKIAVNPNQFRLIEVPVAVMGEVSGKVMFTESTGPNGIGRIIINIYNKDLNLVSRMLTEADGYFSFMGLPPGVYTATADPAQLAKLKMTSSPAVSFTIAQNEEGDVVSDLEFILRKNLEESPSAPDKK